MTLGAHMLWIIGMAIATIAILTVSTLAAAELLPQRRTRRTRTSGRGARS